MSAVRQLKHQVEDIYRRLKEVRDENELRELRKAYQKAVRAYRIQKIISEESAVPAGAAMARQESY